MTRTGPGPLGLQEYLSPVSAAKWVTIVPRADPKATRLPHISLQTFIHSFIPRTEA